MSQHFLKFLPSTETEEKNSQKCLIFLTKNPQSCCCSGWLTRTETRVAGNWLVHLTKNLKEQPEVPSVCSRVGGKFEQMRHLAAEAADSISHCRPLEQQPNQVRCCQLIWNRHFLRLPSLTRMLIDRSSFLCGPRIQMRAASTNLFLFLF